MPTAALFAWPARGGYGARLPLILLSRISGTDSQTRGTIMTDKQFSHVCAACRTPALIAQRKQPALNFLILVAATIGGTVVFSSLTDPHSHATLGTFIVGALLGFVVGYIGLLLPNAQTCKNLPLLPF